MSFTVEKKETRAYPFRSPGSTILENELDLKIVYNKYKTNQAIPSPDAQLRFNLIFCHGTGFNKSIWNYHIRRLYQLSQSFQVPWFLDSVISVDAIGHGDSSLANFGKLGPVCAWEDCARDVIEVIRHEIETTGDFQNTLDSRNVFIGHSMGGFLAFYAAYIAPSLFDAIVPIEAVLYGEPERLTLLKKTVPRMIAAIRESFSTKEEARHFYSDLNFTKNMNRDVMNDYLDDELFKATDPSNGKAVIRTKCSKHHHTAAYMGTYISVPKGAIALPYIRVPILHIAGENIWWNPSENASWIRNTINKRYFEGGVDIKHGGHLVNVERPDDVIEVIKNFISKRDRDFKRERNAKPMVELQGNRKAIYDREMGALANLDVDHVYGFDVDTMRHFFATSKI
ncbi:uncharacterized protein LODBEIA_P09780 [Lodderomyces beijingensis]|uniref:AB hydrolase-1 domain-containing protein n=1 Tax=Lodderomyces beijingensis TaxID=1775926 RepID=A0ABP0ZFY5_9ASCO